MKFFTVSDIHVDYPENLEWVQSLDSNATVDDVLILPGDVTDDLELLESVLQDLASKFLDVIFVPGNHELWVDSSGQSDSLQKFSAVLDLCDELGVKTGVTHYDSLSVVPLFSWYDFSFGEPSRHLRRAWRDFRSCKWPVELEAPTRVNDYFLALNAQRLLTKNSTVISCSHFLPAIDLMPAGIPEKRRIVYPVLGSSLLGEQVAQLNPDIHIYGHSHVNRDLVMESTRYVNNAFAYPSEDRISRKELLCVFDTEEAC